MKTITKFLLALSHAILLSASVAHATCTPGYTWSQNTNNVITFANTSTPIVANSTFFMWNFGDSQNDYTQNPVHTYSAPGTYMVCMTMLDSLSSCTATFCDSVTVYGNVLCNISVAATVSSLPSCPACIDGSAYATVTGGTAPFTFTWSDGENTQSAIALGTGTYTVCVTDANGCNACTTVTVSTQNNACNASFTWSQSQNNIVDFVNTSTNANNNASMYYWNFGDGNYATTATATNVSNNYLNPGNYTVCLYFYDSLSSCNNYFCDSITVYGNSNPTPCNANFVIYPDSINTNQAWVYNLSTGGPNMTYYWSWGDNTFDTIPYPSHIYSSTGSYNICLVVTDVANNCSDTMCQLLWVPRLSEQAASNPYYVNVLPNPTGIQEQVQVSWSLFPNPTSTELTIKTDFTLQGKKYCILDIAGRTVISNTINGNKIDVNSLDNGMYILQIENNKGVYSAQRFMKD